MFARMLRKIFAQAASSESLQSVSDCHPVFSVILLISAKCYNLIGSISFSIDEFPVRFGVRSNI